MSGTSLGTNAGVGQGHERGSSIDARAETEARGEGRVFSKLFRGCVWQHGMAAASDVEYSGVGRIMSAHSRGGRLEVSYVYQRQRPPHEWEV